MPSSSSLKPVVIVGGSGNIGLPLTKILSHSKQFEIFPVVRDASKSKSLFHHFHHVEPLQIENWENVSELKLALNGSLANFGQKALLVLIKPFIPEHIQFVKNWVQAAKESSHVDHIVLLSAIGADKNSQLTMSRDQGLNEEIVEKSGLKFTHIRPGFFHSNNFNHIQTIKSQGAFYTAWENGTYYPIDVDDIALFIGHLIKEGIDKHSGKGYVLTGDEEMSGNQLAEIYTQVLGKPVKHVSLPEDQLEKNMKQFVPNPVILKYLLELNAIVRNGWAKVKEDDWQKVTGKPGLRTREWVEKNKNAYLQ